MSERWRQLNACRLPLLGGLLPVVQKLERLEWRESKRFRARLVDLHVDAKVRPFAGLRFVYFAFSRLTCPFFRQLTSQKSKQKQKHKNPTTQDESLLGFENLL